MLVCKTLLCYKEVKLLEKFLKIQGLFKARSGMSTKGKQPGDTEEEL